MKNSPQFIISLALGVVLLGACGGVTSENGEDPGRGVMSGGNCGAWGYPQTPYDLFTDQATCGRFHSMCVEAACRGGNFPSFVYSWCCHTGECFENGLNCEAGLKRWKRDMEEKIRRPTEEVRKVCGACVDSLQPLWCCWTRLKGQAKVYRRGANEECGWALWQEGLPCPGFEYYRAGATYQATEIGDGLLFCNKKPRCIFTRQFSQACKKDALQTPVRTGPGIFDWKLEQKYHCKGTSVDSPRFIEVIDDGRYTLYQDTFSYSDEYICNQLCTSAEVATSTASTPSSAPTNTSSGSSTPQPVTVVQPSPPAGVGPYSSLLEVTSSEWRCTTSTCSSGAQKGKQFWSCSGGNLFRCDDTATRPYKITCTNGCNTNAPCTDDTCKANVSSDCPTGAKGSGADWSACTSHASCAHGICACASPTGLGVGHGSQCLPNMDYYNSWCSASCPAI